MANWAGSSWKKLAAATMRRIRGFVVVLMSSLIRPSRDRNKHLETFECCCEGVIGTTSWSFKDGVFAFLEKLSRNEIVIAVTVS